MHIFFMNIFKIIFRITLLLRHVMDNFERDELEDSEEDTVTDYSLMNTVSNDINSIDSTDFIFRTMPSSTLVPTISVTPHSSGRNYPILGIIKKLLKTQFKLVCV